MIVHPLDSLSFLLIKDYEEAVSQKQKKTFPPQRQHSCNPSFLDKIAVAFNLSQDGVFIKSLIPAPKNGMSLVKRLEID